MPSPGEFVALHLVARTNAIERQLFVGRAPWGVRGGRTGKAFDGRKVILTRDITDAAFNECFYEMLVHAIDINPPESEVVSNSGEAALVLKDSGCGLGKSEVLCPKCAVRHTPFNARRLFPAGALFLWFTGPDLMDVRKMSNLACFNCLRAVVDRMDRMADSMSSLEGKTTNDLVFSGASYDSFVGQKPWKDAAKRIRKEIQESMSS